MAMRFLPLVAALAAAAPQRYDLRSLLRQSSPHEGQTFIQAYLHPQSSGSQRQPKASARSETRRQSRVIRNDNDFYSFRDYDDRSEETNFITAYENDDIDEYGSCPEGLARRVDGKCVKPSISRNIYLYNTPPQEIEVIPPQYLPEPRVHVNYVFVKTPDAVNGPPPLVVPPAEEKTLVYVLNKNEEQEQQVIELDTPPDNPEVFFVNYADGENPVLPGGIDLRTALRGANQIQDSFELDSDDGFFRGKYDTPSFFARDRSDERERRRGGYRVSLRGGRGGSRYRGRRFSNEFRDDDDLQGSYSTNSESVVKGLLKTINVD